MHSITNDMNLGDDCVSKSLLLADILSYPQHVSLMFPSSDKNGLLRVESCNHEMK